VRENEKIFCPGYGEDITIFRVKCILCSDISKGVRELGYYLFDEELVKRRLEEQACNLGKCAEDALTLLNNAVP